MDQEHEHTSEGGRLFCACGKLVDRDSLRKVRFAGFTGPASLTPSIDRFWSTGDPSVFAKPGAEDGVHRG